MTVAVLITEALKRMRQRALPPLDAPWETILDSWYLVRGDAPVKFAREAVEDNIGVNNPDFLTRNIVRICYALVRKELGFFDYQTDTYMIECGPYVLRLYPGSSSISWAFQYAVSLTLKDNNGNSRKQSIANPNPQSREV